MCMCDVQWCAYMCVHAWVYEHACVHMCACNMYIHMQETLQIKPYKHFPHRLVGVGVGGHSWHILIVVLSLAVAKKSTKHILIIYH